MKTRSALLIVDYQNDFCPGGALAVADGHTVVGILNQYIELFDQHQCPIIASRDWHPRQSQHFKEYGGIWPAHCVVDTQGAFLTTGAQAL